MSASVVRICRPSCTEWASEYCRETVTGTASSALCTSIANIDQNSRSVTSLKSPYVSCKRMLAAVVSDIVAHDSFAAESLQSHSSESRNGRMNLIFFVLNPNSFLL
jgi:hypothetical protein